MAAAKRKLESQQPSQGKKSRKCETPKSTEKQMSQEDLEENFSPLLPRMGEENVPQSPEIHLTKDRAMDAYAHLTSEHTRQFFSPGPNDEVFEAFGREATKQGHVFLHLEQVVKDSKDMVFLTGFVFPNCHLATSFDPEFGLRRTDENKALKAFLYDCHIVKVVENPGKLFSQLKWFLPLEDESLRYEDLLFVDVGLFCRNFPQTTDEKCVEIKDWVDNYSKVMLRSYSRGIPYHHRKEYDARKNTKDFGFKGRVMLWDGDTPMIQKFETSEFGARGRREKGDIPVFSQGRLEFFTPVPCTDVNKTVQKQFGGGAKFYQNKVLFLAFAEGHPEQKKWADLLLAPALHLARHAVYYVLTVRVGLHTESVSLKTFLRLLQDAFLDLMSDLEEGMHPRPFVKARRHNAHKGYQPKFMTERIQRRGLLGQSSFPWDGRDDVYGEEIYVEDLKSLNETNAVQDEVYDYYSILLAAARDRHDQLNRFYLATCQEGREVLRDHAKYDEADVQSRLRMIKKGSKALEVKNHSNNTCTFPKRYPCSRRSSSSTPESEPS